MKLIKGKRRIYSIEDWFLIAPPKRGEHHWKDGRSAKECARSWLETGSAALPKEIIELFDSHPHTRGFSPDKAEPERQIRFDQRGEPRNADLALIGLNSNGRIACTVEAKADEPFDRLLPAALCDSLEDWRRSSRSAGVDRIKDLVQSVLPIRAPKLPKLSKIRYQLLTTVAGTIAWANECKCDKAVLVIHEFQSSKTSPKRLSRNTADLDTFIRRLSNGKVASVPTGEMQGPFTIPGQPLFQVGPQLYIGKAVRKSD